MKTIHILLLNLVFISSFAWAQKDLSHCSLQKTAKKTNVLSTKTLKQIDSYDPKSKTEKNKLIKSGVTANLQIIELTKSLDSCVNNDAELKLIQTEIEKQTKLLATHANSYCMSVLMPNEIRNTKSNGEEIAAEQTGCNNKKDSATAKFIFDVCTENSKDYDAEICQCHVKSRSNSCLTEKIAAKKLEENIKLATNENCDEKTKSNNDSIITTKNVLTGILAIGAICLIYSQMKKNKSDAMSGNTLNNIINKPTSSKPDSTNSATNHTGNYSGIIKPGSGGVFGDGSWLKGDQTIMVEQPNVRGLGYALGSGGEKFHISVASDGKLSGYFKIWGHSATIVRGQLPAGSNQVDFIVDGATGQLTFSNGTVTGKIYEPGPTGHEWETHKFGTIEGSRD